jgi:uncharacterized protein (TIGR03437 family)
LKRILSISHLILPLFALASALCLSAQTVVVDKATLTFSGQFGGSAVTQTVNVTSSTGSAVAFTLSYPSYPWLKVNGQPFGFFGTTPAAITVTADPTGLSTGIYGPANIVVSGGSSSTNPPIAVTFNVSTIGVNPASLAFTYTVLSNIFPASQVITLSSSVATQCTAAAATTSGGSWFTLLQNSCNSPGSLTVLINNAVVAGLAPNTYNGTVTITPSPASQGPAFVVPVTLTVSPTPPVTVNPPSLLLNFQTGIGAANPSQTFTISTTASQPLGFTISQSGEFVNISSFSPSINGSTSSSTPAQVAYTVNPSGLALGAHTGTIMLSTPQGTPQQTNIPVTLNVSNTALLNVPNATLNFTGQLGNTPASQTVNITATSGILNYSVTQSANSAWLSVPNAGNTAAPLTVSVNPAVLPPGTYSATINVLSATPGSTAQQIPVVLKVTNDPTISASASTLSFPYQIGQSVPATQSVKITSSTGVPLNYSVSLATTTCGSAWLQAANANNSLSGVTPPNDNLTVAVAPAGLAAGTCNGTLTINATNPATGAAVVNSPIGIAVTLFVSTSAQLVLTPAKLQPFTVGVGAASPPQQTIALTSTSSDVLNYTVAFQSNNGGSWLFAGPQTGSTSAGFNVLTVTVITPGLAVGAYSGTVTVTATGPGGVAVADSPVIIPVTLNVSAGSLTLSATDLTFPDQTLGGPAPASQAVTIGSSGQALNYNAVANSNNSVIWLAVSPASGNTSTSGVLTVAVDGSKLTPGPYTGTILVTSPGAGNSPVTITVHFKVNPGTLVAPNTTLTFTQAAGGPAPAAQSIAVSGSPVPLNFTVVSATFNGVNWLSATPASGATPASVQVSVNGASLAVAQYTGTVTIASAGAAGSPIAVGVILNVVPPPVLAASATSLSFAYTIGLAAPAAQNLTVTSTGGSGNVPVTAQVQYAGAAVQSWLTVTPTASNNTPATFAVSVATSGLAAGKYTGQIVIASPISLASVTIPVTLTVMAIPQPVVGKVANAASYSTGSVSPGENIVIFGSGIGPAAITIGVPVNNVFPSLVGNTRVLFDNIAAPMIYASDGQTSVMVPYAVAGRSTTTIVVEYSGVQSAPITQIVALAAPGIYTLNQQGTGPGAILNQDGLTVNSLNAPEKRGNVIAIYMTGEGQTNPQGADGVVIPAVVSALKVPQQTVTVTIGGVPAVVAYAGSAPSLISGVMQVNAIIPLTAPTGTQPVVVTVGTVQTQSGASAATVVVQ